jgi:hypothetical protein
LGLNNWECVGAGGGVSGGGDISVDLAQYTVHYIHHILSRVHTWQL